MDLNRGDKVVSETSSLELFQKLCKEHRVHPQEELLEQLKGADSARDILNLSECSLNTKICQIIGKTLARDESFRQLILKDCMLPEEGVKVLLNHLCKNVALRTIDLKGNNIRGVGALAVGKFLKNNNCIENLYLEWNSIGTLTESISALSEGLIANTSLKNLDLRNNQISQEGAALLADALQRNSILQSLDLRWNNIGLLGARCLINALQVNKSLQKLELAGNNIPNDLLKLLETLVRGNFEHQLSISEHLKRTQLLTKELGNLDRERSSQLNKLSRQLVKQEENMSEMNKTSFSKIAKLQEALEERKSAFISLAAKLENSELALNLTQKKNKQLEEDLRKLKQDNDDICNQHIHLLQQERQERSEREQVMLNELSAAKERVNNLELQLADLERKCKLQQNQITALREEIIEIQSNMRIKIAECNEVLNQEKQQHREQITQMDETRKLEIERAKQASQLEIQNLQSQLKHLQSQKEAVQDEITQINKKFFSEKLEIEEKLHLTQFSKSEQEKLVQSQMEISTKLQTKVNSLLQELKDERETCIQLKIQHTVKEEESQHLLDKAREELKRQQEIVTKQNTINCELTSRIQKLEETLNNLEKSHAVDLQQKDIELTRVKEQLRLKEDHWHHLQEEDLERASMLQSAIMSYMNSNRSRGRPV